MVPARRFEQIVGADDVGLQHRLPRRLARDAAEMHNAADARYRLLDGFRIGEIGCHKMLVVAKIGGSLEVAQTQLIDVLEQAAQPRANSAGRARNQDSLHVMGLDCHYWRGRFEAPTSAAASS